MNWRDWTALAALTLMLLGNNLKFMEDERLQYLGVFAVMIATFTLAIAWPFGAGT